MKKLPTDYQHFIYVSRYSRWIESENRRENWDETVKRYFDFFENLNMALSFRRIFPLESVSK